VIKEQLIRCLSGKFHHQWPEPFLQYFLRLKRFISNSGLEKIKDDKDNNFFSLPSGKTLNNLTH
jgi:hypothetical protein